MSEVRAIFESDACPARILLFLRVAASKTLLFEMLVVGSWKLEQGDEGFERGSRNREEGS